MKEEEFVLQEMEMERQKKINPDAVFDRKSIKLMVANEAPYFITKACEIFIEELASRSWTHTARSRRRTLQKGDVHLAVGESEVFDFLIDIVPRVVRPAPPQVAEGTPNFVPPVPPMAMQGMQEAMMNPEFAQQFAQSMAQLQQQQQQAVQGLAQQQQAQVPQATNEQMQQMHMQQQLQQQMQLQQHQQPKQQQQPQQQSLPPPQQQQTQASQQPLQQFGLLFQPVLDPQQPSQLSVPASQESEEPNGDDQHQQQGQLWPLGNIPGV